MGARTNFSVLCKRTPCERCSLDLSEFTARSCRGGLWNWDVPYPLCESGQWVSLKHLSCNYKKTRLLTDHQTVPSVHYTGAPQYKSTGSVSANKPPMVRDVPVRVSSAGVVQADMGRKTEQKRNGLQGNWGYGMRRASGEEFIKALVWRETHTGAHCWRIPNE